VVFCASVAKDSKIQGLKGFKAACTGIGFKKIRVFVHSWLKDSKIQKFKDSEIPFR
jgi:hypothetical protein